MGNETVRYAFQDLVGHHRGTVQQHRELGRGLDRVQRTELQDEHLGPLLHVAGQSFPVASLHPAEGEGGADREVEGMNDLGELPDRVEHHVQSHVDAVVPELSDGIIGGEDQHALALARPDGLDQLLRVLGRADQHRRSRDGVVDEGQSQLPQYAVRDETGVHGALVGLGIVQVLQGLDDLGRDHGGLAGDQGALQVRGLPDLAARLAQDAGQVSQFLRLGTVPGVYGRQFVGGLRVLDLLVVAMLLDRHPQQLVGEAGGDERAVYGHAEQPGLESFFESSTT